MSQHANAATAMAPATVAARCPAQSDHCSSQYGGDEPGDAWHAQPPVPEVVYSAPDGHKGLVVRAGQCRTRNDRREYVCAVNDPAGKHGRRDEHLAERCHFVLWVSPRLNAGITPICWKSSR